MKGALAFSAGLVAPWLALFGLVALILGYAVVEVIVVELAALVLAVLAAGLLISDLVGCPCDHSIDCSDTWGGP